MYNVGFPYEYGGLAASEVTAAEVLSKAGYATAFYGKAHIGGIEASYLTNHCFDEALWTPLQSGAEPLYAAGTAISAGSRCHVPRNVGKDPYT